MTSALMKLTIFLIQAYGLMILWIKNHIGDDLLDLEEPGISPLENLFGKVD